MSIYSVHPSFQFPQFSGNIHSSINHRLESLKSRIDRIKERLGLSRGITVEFIKFYDSESCKGTKVFLPSYYLLDPIEVPNRFRYAVLNELESDRILLCEDFFNWLQDDFREKGVPLELIPQSFDDVLPFFSLLTYNPSSYEDSLDFSMAHELAHIKRNKDRVFKTITGCMAGLLSAFAVLFLSSMCLAVSSISVKNMGLTLYFVILALTALYLTYMAVSIHSAHGPEEEKKVDLDAVEALNDASGGIHNFMASLRVSKMMKNIYQATFRASADPANEHSHGNPHASTHPSDQERIMYLREWQTFRPSFV